MIRLRNAAIILAGAYILLSPAIPQVFGQGSKYVRHWTMFAGVGQGIMKGHFTLTHADGVVEELTPLEVLGLQRYPNTFHYTFSSRLMKSGHLPSVVREYCETRLPEGGRLAFAGRVGVRHGWATHEAEDICGRPASSDDEQAHA